MYTVGRIGSYFARGVYTVSGPFHPFGGAVDIIVVEQPDGSFKSSPWYVRFGKFQGVLKTREKIVSIDVNGVEADFTMFLDHKGEAYFVREVNVEEGECVPDPDQIDQQSSSDISPVTSNSCGYDADPIAVTEKKILTRSNSRRERILGLVFGRRSSKEVGEDGVGMVRLSSLQRADYAADLLEVKWSTNLASSRVTCTNVSGDKQVDGDEHSPVELLVRDDEKNSSYNSVLAEEVSMDISSLDTKEVETSSPLDEGVIEERVEMVSEMSRIDDFGVDNVDHDVSEEHTLPDSVLLCELEACDRKQFDEEVASDEDATVPGSGGSEESGSNRGQSFVYSETSESLIVGLDGLTEQAQKRLYLANGECGEVHLHLESFHRTNELLNEDAHVDIGEDPTSGSCSEQIHAAPCELDYSVSFLGKPLGVQELSTQTITVDLAISSIEEMESQNIRTTSIVNTEVEDGNNLHMLRSTGNSQKLCGDDAMGKIDSNAPSENLEIEDGNNLHMSLRSTGNSQKIFGDDAMGKIKSNAPSEVSEEEGDLDEFKVSEVADESSSNFVKTVNHLLCDDGGDKEEKESVDTNAEVLSSSSDALVPELSTQIVTIGPSISSSKEMESQNIGTTSIVNLEVQDWNNLHMSLGSTGNSQKLFGDDAMGKIKSNAPSEVSDEEQLLFGDLDEFKVSELADASSSDFVEKDNHLLCDDGGNKEVKGSLNTNAEVFPSSSDVSVQELSTQIVTVDPAISSSKEMESQNISTTSIVNLEVEDGNNLHMSLGSAGNSQKLFGDDAVGQIKSNAPSEVSDEEQLLFGDLDEFKGSDMANASSSDFVKNVNHLLCGDGGNKEVKGSVKTNAEVFSSSSDVSVQPSDPNGPEKSVELLTVKSNPIPITKNLDSDDNIGRMTESLPIMWSPTLNHTADETQHPLSQSLDTISDSLKWTLLCETDCSSNANEDLHFTQEQPDTTETLVTEELKAAVSSPVGGTTSQPIVSSGGSWSLWPFSLNRSSSKKDMQPAVNEKQLADAEYSTKSGNCMDGAKSAKSGNCMDGAKSASESKIVKQILKSTTPTSEQLASLNLKEGGNKIIFTFSTPMLGKQQVDARIYLWKWNTRVVISDVDGTITKSDVLGQFMPLVGMDWSQTGVVHLFSAIKENGYQFLFLSARSISQAYITRQFLFNLKQDGKALPEGPVVISPDGLFPSLFREVIRRAPHEFKIACLETIRDLFPADCNPFYAGFGNRDTDEISYLKVGIPRGKIFTINPRGEIVVNRRVDRKSYSSLHALVHDMFPPTNSSDEQEDFNDINFWKLPPPDIDI